MKRYLRLYLYFLRFSLSKAMEFRVDFFFRVVMDLFFYSVQFMFFNIIYLHTDLLGGWDQEQMKLFVVSFIFVDAFHMTFFANNTWWFPISINRGDLDYYLTRPASSFFFLAFKEFAANSMLNLIIGSILLGYFLFTSTLEFGAFKLIGYVLLLINGAFLYFMTFMIFLLSVFWTSSPKGFADVFYAGEKAMHKPDGIYKGYMRRLFVNILPFSIMASYPVRFLTQENSFEVFTVIGLASFLIYSVVFVLWKLGLKNYSSASS